MPQAAFAARNTSSHALLSVFAANGIDRVYLVPGESYLGILDALNDFPQIDVLTCRHEAGAGFMACADGRLTRRPGLVLVSRGPGASNASIALHTAQQDAIPLILVIGQIPAKDLRKEAFQEIDYQKSFGSIAKWVAEATAPEQLAEIAFKAVRIATSGQPGPVVIVVPEDIQQQAVAVPDWVAVPHAPATATAATRECITGLMAKAERPLIIAGGGFDVPGGREALLALAEAWNMPVALSFRRHDLFPLTHRLYAGDLGLANPVPQMAAFHDSDLILALGTRLDDITSQGYTFPRLPKPAQTLVHCYPDDHIVGLHFAADIALVADAIALAQDLTPAAPAAGEASSAARVAWAARLRSLYEGIAAWPVREAHDGVDFAKVVRSLAERAPRDMALCVDAGTFAAPVYRHFPFVPPQRLMAPLSGAMGYGTPAAVATQLRCPGRRVVAMVGDGGFLMTGNEMIAAVERKLPILFIVSNNNSYASIRIHQDANYPGRHLGTSLFNPDFTAMARAFGMRAETVVRDDEIDAALERGLAATEPYFIEVRSSLAVSLPKAQAR
jgi:acetolactate synthase-1/2/3 large subunit